MRWKLQFVLYRTMVVVFRLCRRLYGEAATRGMIADARGDAQIHRLGIPIPIN